MAVTESARAIRLRIDPLVVVIGFIVCALVTS
jgi:preprotein translocase subunit Sec61beta